MPPTPKKLLDRVRDAIRLKHYAYSTEKTYVYWARRFVLYHKKRHPLEMGEKEISEFLTYLAVEENVAASTQNQALSALTVTTNPRASGPEPHTSRALVRPTAGRPISPDIRSPARPNSPLGCVTTGEMSVFSISRKSPRASGRHVWQGSPRGGTI